MEIININSYNKLLKKKDYNMKKCSVCGKDIETGRKCSECKERALKEYNKKHYAEHKEEIKAAHRKWYAELKTNPEKYNALKERHKEKKKKNKIKKKALNGKLAQQIFKLAKKRDIAIDKEFNVSAIYRKPNVIIPRGDTTLLSGDKVFIMVASEHKDAIASLFTRKIGK